MKKSSKYNLEVAGRTLSFEINKVAPQANASVIARYGDTEILATVMLGPEKSYSDGGAPLTVDFVERLYAGGIIKGSRWVKREGRPTDESIITNRVIDRAIRPLFPKDMANEVQIVITLLSTDNANDHDILALNAVSLALAVSNIPWNGPVGAVRMGYISKDEAGYVANPLVTQKEFSDLDLIVAANADGVIMIEAGAKQLTEDKTAVAIEKALEESQKLVKFISKIQEEIGSKKFVYAPQGPDSDLEKEIEKNHAEEIEEFVKVDGPMAKMDSTRVEEYKKALAEKYSENQFKSQIPQIVESIFKKALRQKALEKKERIDGRKPTTVRPITVEVSLLPRTHGSGLFQRGLTQVLSVVTLASPSLEQWIETAEGMEEKRYIHHYNAPPYSSGETGRMGGLNRREIGHGALAERALESVIPGEDKFPYTIRVVSEVLSQNGSSSMGSTCGSTLALMDAGVPILSPVSGIAMGLVAKSQKDYVILSDLRGEEDFYGNMDFKVAGTKNGITAIQVDIKLNNGFGGLTMIMIRETLEQARLGRLEIMEKMLAVLPESRKKVSQYAPKVVTLKVPVDKIGEVIGPGGKNIRNIIATTGAAVDVDDDGTVAISAIDEAAVERARAWIDGQTRELQPGEEFEGEVKRILPFGAFVEILPGKEGLVHVSRMSAGYVGNPEEIVKVGQKVKVKVTEIDEMGRLNLAMYWGPKDDNTQSPNPNFQPPRRDFRPQRPPFRGGGRGAMPTGRQGFGGPRRGGFDFGNQRGGRRDRY